MLSSAKIATAPFLSVLPLKCAFDNYNKSNKQWTTEGGKR
jgi:hypothetical protein